MLSWVTKAAQSTLATVAGTAEPIYGPEAFHSVALQEDQNPTYEVPPEDLKWQAIESTSAETQTWYIEADNGHYAIVQVIYTNVANLHVTSQLNVKVFHPNGTILWSTKSLTNQEFDEHKRNFYADDLSVTLSENNTFTIKSVVDPEALVDIKMTRTGRDFKIGKDGRSNFGTDPENPWGFIKHMFWPRGKVEGVIVAKDVKIDITGKAMFIMALQGMKPHHAASTWDFMTFQGPTVSAVMMKFTTPPSYGSSTVNVSGIVTDTEVIEASTKGVVEHTESKMDEVTEWPEPQAMKWIWAGKTQDGKDVEATMAGKLDEKKDRVDFMEHVPTVIKNFVAGAVGTRPYIYQYSQKMILKMRIGEETKEEEGTMFAEATFIS